MLMGVLLCTVKEERQKLLLVTPCGMVSAEGMLMLRMATQ